MATIPSLADIQRNSVSAFEGGGGGFDYVQNTEPSSPAEGEIWGDTGTNPLNRGNHTGTQALSTIAQSSAAIGDVAQWNGTVWAPSNLGPADFWFYERLNSQTVSAPTSFLGAVISSGTNTTAIPAASLVTGAFGGVFIRSSTTANGGYRYTGVSAQSVVFGTGTWKYRCHYQPRTSFTDRLVRCGFLDTTTNADATDGAYFEINGSTCSAKTANNSTRTIAGTTVTLSVNTFYTFDIDVNAAGTEARFRVYANNDPAPILDQTITTNIPTTTARATGYGIVLTEASTTASDIGVFYGQGIGTIAAFQRVMGPG